MIDFKMAAVSAKRSTMIFYASVKNLTVEQLKIIFLAPSIFSVTIVGLAP